MYLGPDGYWVQDHAGESVPCAYANIMIVAEKRKQSFTQQGWDQETTASEKEIEDGQAGM